MEAIVAELLTALGAEEVLGVPGLVQSCHAFLNGIKIKLISWQVIQSFVIELYIQNWTVAVSATWTEEIVVISLAVGISIALEEVSGAQFLIAVIASEVLRVPCLAQCRDHLTDDRLVACVTAAFLHRVDSLTWHIRLKIAKHKLELIASLFAFVERGFNDRFFARLIVCDAFRWLRVVSDWLLLMLLLLWIDLHSEQREEFCCENFQLQGNADEKKIGKHLFACRFHALIRAVMLRTTFSSHVKHSPTFLFRNENAFRLPNETKLCLRSRDH